MKKIVLMYIALFIYSCNMSDQQFKLPSDYLFIKEGGNSNIVLKNNKLIIDKGAVDFSFENNFIFFSVDTGSSMESYKISKEKLVYFIHDIHEDTISKSLNYNFVKEFMRKKNIRGQANILEKQ